MGDGRFNRLTLVEDKENRLIYELPIQEINLVDVEQLEELKKPQAFFFNCVNYTVKEDAVLFFYEKENGYMNIVTFREGERTKLKAAALQLLQLERLIGTQYTTVLHPQNIFMKADGTLKLAHRGVRNVFPHQGLTKAKLVADLRKLFIYLFSDLPFEQLEDTYHLPLNDPLLIKIQQSKTLDELKLAIEQAQKVRAKPSQVVPKGGGKRKKPILPLERISLLTGLLSGLVVGMAAIYFFQVVPLNQTSVEEVAAVEKRADDEMMKLREEMEALENQQAEDKKIIQAYQALLQGETEEAVSLLETLDNLGKAEEELLFELYMEMDTPESLAKALELGEAYETEAIVALADLDSDEADEIILLWESESAEVEIEQAFINKDYETVIELAEELEDSERAQYLAARSYIEKEQPEEAFAIGEELGDESIQIDSLRLEQELLEDNDDLDEEEIEERIEEIEEMLDELRG